MKTRLALTTVLATAALTLSACADDEPETPSDPETSASPSESATSAAPTEEPTTPASPSAETPTGVAADLVGDWADETGEWALHFKDDGTFTLDVDGNETTSGSFSVEGDVVTLTGADGNDQTGRIVGEDLEFRFGTLVRQIS
ncbi:hypothetical protein [Aeromicrobium sp. IC_218]|uniref:hypothetical protein n=1 Tax=Aeromicrobium sp. IC_218 TaxID=2545468 RepID=UPI00103FDF77|nr:hypothetical protein [Aeromicrobium sp. IC_218]TCI97477.1 hypothetical protein E0W78_11815 [Aeromicrobium sp. IC_218]